MSLHRILVILIVHTSVEWFVCMDMVNMLMLCRPRLYSGTAL